jgi:hypothetical protein
MPRFPIKPLITLTKEQWRELLKRVFEKEAKLTPRAAREIMSTFEPQAEREMGSLIKRRALGGGEFEEAIERLPIGEARAKYFADPGEYIPGRAEPSAKVLTQPKGTGEMDLPPEDLAQRIGYERLKFKPIIPSGTQQAAGVIRGEASAAEPGRGIQAGGEVPPVSEIVQTALIADTLWKDIGGLRSVDGKWWQQLLESSRGAIKKHYTTGRDYFISSYYNWKKDPNKFRQNFPRETKLLEKAEKKFNESTEGTLTGAE